MATKVRRMLRGKKTSPFCSTLYGAAGNPIQLSCPAMNGVGVGSPPGLVVVSSLSLCPVGPRTQRGGRAKVS